MKLTKTLSLFTALCLLLAAGRATNTGPPAARRATPPFEYRMILQTGSYKYNV